jgi:hypothetical protein
MGIVTGFVISLLVIGFNVVFVNDLWLVSLSVSVSFLYLVSILFLLSVSLSVKSVCLISKKPSFDCFCFGRSLLSFIV